MSAPHDRPTAAEMVEAVGEWIRRSQIDGEIEPNAFHARVAANMLRIVERELALGPGKADEEFGARDAGPRCDGLPGFPVGVDRKEVAFAGTKNGGLIENATRKPDKLVFGTPCHMDALQRRQFDIVDR